MGDPLAKLRVIEARCGSEVAFERGFHPRCRRCGNPWQCWPLWCPRCRAPLCYWGCSPPVPR